ncbi:MAG: carbon-nitrogen hydrolase family protein, partial [Acidobacteriota bacterium]
QRMSKNSPAPPARSLTVAIVQATTESSAEQHLDKTAQLIEQAAREGARLVVFGETWLGGYPAWLDHCREVALWGHEATKEAYADYRRRSITVPGDETERLGRLAADLGVVLVIGASERVDAGPGNGTLYNTLLTFDASGELINHHRKLVPTYTERLVWGPGDGHGLRALPTAAGRVGGLVCWEHFMPLARQKLHRDGEEVHVAVWPTVVEMHQVASRHYAFEGRCFVLAAGQLMHEDDIPAGLSIAEGRTDDGLLLRGGSAVIAPDGSYLAGPTFDQEQILMAELDFGLIDQEAMTLDVSGHYQRPDLFDFECHPGPPRRPDPTG